MTERLTLCTTDRCPLHGKCARKRLPAQTELGRYQDYPGGEDCPGFVPHRQRSLFEE